MLSFELTKDTPYLALSGELWSVFYEYFNRNWPCYKGFLLYLVRFILMTINPFSADSFIVIYCYPYHEILFMRTQICVL